MRRVEEIREIPMNELHRIGVVIGRFQPLHKAHLSEVILPALQQVDTLIILLGSSRRPRTPKDPWTDEDRADMIYLGLKDSGVKIDPYGKFLLRTPGHLAIQKSIHIVPIRDSAYSNTQWQLNVQEKVREAIANEKRCGNMSDFGGPRIGDKEVEISLFGVDRDESTFYLDFFPQWKSKTLVRDGKKDIVNGTMCRDLIFSHADWNREEWDELVTPSVADFIVKWIKTAYFENINAEFNFLNNYKNEMLKFKYPVIFQTADNIILWKGHVLLANRRSFPGKGLWALPGGFIDSNKTIQQSSIDIAKEKTKLQLKPEWLVSSKTFDSPKRSLRGRTITTAHLWKLPDSFNFDVEAGKNTNKVQWFQFCEVMQMSDVLYEDHYDIILDMLSTIK